MYSKNLFCYQLCDTKKDTNFHIGCASVNRKTNSCSAYRLGPFFEAYTTREALCVY